MPDDERPPLPPTCQTDEPWVDPWSEQPLVDWGSSQEVNDGGGWLYAIALTLSGLTLSVLLGLLIGLTLSQI